MRAADFRELAREKLRGKWKKYILIMFLAMALGGTFGPQLRRLFCRGYYGKALRLHMLRGLLVEMGALALTLPVCLLYAWLNPDHFLPASLLVTVLVLPGQIVAYRYAMADFLMLSYPEMGVMQALRESGRRMRGRKWKLYCLQLSFIGWALVSILPGAVLLGNDSTSTAQLLGRALNMLFTVVPVAYMNVAMVAFFRHDPAAEAKSE